MKFTIVGFGFIGEMHVQIYQSLPGLKLAAVVDINWELFIAALKEIGYVGWFAAEMIPSVPFHKHTPEVLVDNTSRAMDAIFKLA
jgi:predicted dehydrogenase